MPNIKWLAGFTLALLVPFSAVASETLLRCSGIELEYSKHTDDDGMTSCGLERCSSPATKFYVFDGKDVFEHRTNRAVVREASGTDAINQRQITDSEIDLLSISRVIRADKTEKYISRKSFYVNRITGEAHVFRWYSYPKPQSFSFSGVCEVMSSEQKF